MSETISTGATSAPSQGSSGAQASSTPSASAPTSNGTAQGQSQAAPTGAGANQNSGQPSSGDQAQGAEAQAPRRLGATDMDALVEVKIDGKVHEMPLKDVVRLQQLEKVSRQKMSEAQRAHAEAQKLQQLAKSDPERYMREVLGIEPKSWAEERLAREYEMQQMSPEARRALELEQENQTLKQREAKTREPLLNEIQKYVSPEMFKQIQAEAEGASLEQIQRFASQKKAEFQAGLDQTSNELLDAWQKTGLPRQKDFGAWMAQVMVEHNKKSIEHKNRTGEDLPPLHPEAAAAKVKTRFLNSTKSLFSQMDAKAIQETLGAEIIQKLRDYDVQQVSTQAAPQWAPNEIKTPQPIQQKGYMNEAEYRAWLKGG